MNRTVLIMDKQNPQMNASHPETNLPVGYPPQYPPTAFQGPPGYNGYPGPQVGYPPPPAGHSGPGPAGFPVPNQPVYNQPVYNQPGGAAGVPWMPAPPPPLNCPPGLEYLSQIDQILIHQQIELLEGYVIQTWHPCLPKFTIQNEKRDDVLKISGPCVVCSCCGDVDFEIKSLDEQCVVGKISKHWTGILREAFTDADNFGIQFPLDLDVKMKAVMLGACFLIDFMFFESTGSQEQRSGVW
ncbi:phospholipid scramblase 1 isoform X4 [Nomascus leucogenys]|uniref:phospholipid scramblase 1 isoform X4 n=1 Tax=Nomascus leucogenys TaxID=61853 RepID=UPI00122DA7F8|nr:phospholipid scramblase 1 isoform X4 [Nomascus leucogenys]